MLSCIRLERQGFQVALTKKRHVEWLYTPPDENGTIELLSSRSPASMPLAWGAKAHAGMGHRDPFFCRPLKARGSCVP